MGQKQEKNDIRQRRIRSVHLLSALTKKLGFDLFGDYSYQLTSEQSVKADYMPGTLLENQDVNKRGNADRKAFSCGTEDGTVKKRKTPVFFGRFCLSLLSFSASPKLCMKKAPCACKVLVIRSLLSVLKKISPCWIFFVKYRFLFERQFMWIVSKHIENLLFVKTEKPFAVSIWCVFPPNLICFIVFIPSI